MYFHLTNNGCIFVYWQQTVLRVYIGYIGFVPSIVIIIMKLVFGNIKYRLRSIRDYTDYSSVGILSLFHRSTK